MNKSVSFYDTGAEGFYHGLVLGLVALMDNQYKIKSNREAGVDAVLKLGIAFSGKKACVNAISKFMLATYLL